MVSRLHVAFQTGQIVLAIGRYQCQYLVAFPATWMSVPGRVIDRIDLVERRLGIKAVR